MNEQTHTHLEWPAVSSSMFRDPKPLRFSLTVRFCSSCLSLSLTLSLFLSLTWHFSPCVASSETLLLIPVSNNEPTEAMRHSELQSTDSPRSSPCSSAESGAVRPKPKHPRRLKVKTCSLWEVHLFTLEPELWGWRSYEDVMWKSPKQCDFLFTSGML